LIKKTATTLIAAVTIILTTIRVQEESPQALKALESRA